MSAAATAAGYLYASGRLRGRNSRESAEADRQPGREEHPSARRREVRVAVLPAQNPQEKPAPGRRAPTVQYRTRRWRPADE